jgi:ATP-dependent RNA helicase RhlE
MNKWPSRNRVTYFCMNKKTTKNPSGFSDMGIAVSIQEVLHKMKLDVPTPIQKKSIPVAVEGLDIIGIAQTGTGKTFAFGIPMLQRLALYKGRGLVLLPTRELALQVDENLKKLGSVLGLRTVVLIGGEPIMKQISLLKKKPHILVATPGRLIDCINRKLVKLDDVKVLVLDEADMMFDMGFAPQIEEILKTVPKERQTMLFSATMPQAIVKLATRHMSLPVNIEVAPAGTTVENVNQEIYIMKKEDKLKYLGEALKNFKGKVLVFTRTKHQAKALTRSIQLMGHRSAEIHSNRSLAQRREALDGFKSNKYRVLTATDIAARGIDVTNIELVVNYDLPENSEDYVHRIGRTARAGKNGKAISFATTTQGREIRSIERLINKQLPLTKYAELEFARSPMPSPSGPRRFGYNQKRPSGPRTSPSSSGARGTYPKTGAKNYSSPSRASSLRTRTNNTPRPLTDKQRFRASIRQAK